MSVARAVVAAVLLSAVASAQVPPPGPPATEPAAPVPTTQVPAVQVPPPETAAVPPITARTFSAPAGFLFNTVRRERQKDFELFLGYLKIALDKATDPNVQTQARGWSMFRATEPGPNNTILYVFVLDPTVMEADYSLGRILADAYPDAVELMEIWKLYTSSIVGGGSLLNLTPVTPAVPVAPLVPVAPAAPEAAPGR
jgi:hypothetical protein